jgi:hypothetical protein
MQIAGGLPTIPFKPKAHVFDPFMTRMTELYQLRTIYQKTKPIVDRYFNPAFAIASEDEQSGFLSYIAKPFSVWDLTL